jgi:alanine racemase
MPLNWVEINKANLAHNLAQYKKLAPQSAIWPVVKSNAYGHGLKEIVGLLDKNKQASGFMVVNLEEALAVAELSQKPTMVLSYFDKNNREALALANQKNISLPVYDLETINFLNDLGKKLKHKFLLNLKIDTGASRLGFRSEEITRVASELKNKPWLELYSIFTHYAESEAENLTFTEKQLQILNNLVKQFFADFKDLKVHSACSASAISLPASQQHIVRLGLGLYGLWPSEVTRQRAAKLGLELKPVLSWKTKIIQIKNILAGETIGYDRTYECTEDCRIAVLPLGYYEGYSRLLSNKAQVLINGQRYKIRGNICMNLMMVELPQSSQLKRGETVTILGQEKKENISAEELATLSQTINYEIVTRIKTQLPRVII